MRDNPKNLNVDNTYHSLLRFQLIFMFQSFGYLFLDLLHAFTASSFVLTEIGALSCTSDLRCSYHLVSCLGRSVKRPGGRLKGGQKESSGFFPSLVITGSVSDNGCVSLMVLVVSGQLLLQLMLGSLSQPQLPQKVPRNFLSWSSSALPHVSLFQKFQKLFQLHQICTLYQITSIYMEQVLFSGKQEIIYNYNNLIIIYKIIGK